MSSRTTACCTWHRWARSARRRGPSSGRSSSARASCTLSPRGTRWGATLRTPPLSNPSWLYSLRSAGSPEASSSAEACLRRPQAPASLGQISRLGSRWPDMSGLFSTQARAERRGQPEAAGGPGGLEGQPVSARVVALLRLQREGGLAGRRLLGGLRARGAAVRAAVHQRGQSDPLAVSWQPPSSAPAPPQGAPGGSGRLGAPRKRPAHRDPSRSLGCSS
jgi:hypothetical protein